MGFLCLQVVACTRQVQVDLRQSTCNSTKKKDTCVGTRWASTWLLDALSKTLRAAIRKRKSWQPLLTRLLALSWWPTRTQAGKLWRWTTVGLTIGWHVTGQRTWRRQTTRH